MFEVGFSELLVIFALALVVLGPERLPKLAAQVGRWIGRARAMARQFREQLEAEANAIDPAASTSYTPPPERPEPEPPAAAEPDTPVDTQTQPPIDAPIPMSASSEPASQPESPHERGG